MSKTKLKDLLIHSDRPIVADGGITTSLYDKGFYINRSFEELSVTHAEAVREVTKEFYDAGARILKTNTFGATRPKLQEYNIEDRLVEILQASVQIAKDIADENTYVVGSLGPLGVLLEPLGPTSREEAQAMYEEAIEIMVNAGVDGFLLEAFSDLNGMEVVLKALAKAPDLAVLPHLSIQMSMKSNYGHTLAEFVKLCEDYQVDAVGLAGEVGPSGMLTACNKLVGLTNRPISILPNAGLPRYVNDQYIYLCNPDYMGKYAKRLVQAGARIVGGHSGVHAPHIRAVSNSLRMAQSTARNPVVGAEHIQPIVDKPIPESDIGSRSRLGEKLKNGERIISVEINPPRGIDFKKFLTHCEDLEKAGVEFVNIPDGARASARMSSTQLSAYVARNFGLEPIPHFTTRDRNLLGLQSDLLGAYVNGVKNLLLVTGDPPKLGNVPGATGVYDVDAIGLTHIVRRMNQGLDLGGSSFGEPTHFMIGVALNPTAPNSQLELERFKYKVDAGAEFVMTQPIYDVDAYKRFMDKSKGVTLPTIMGIWPLVSLRNAEFLKNEVPGVEVPDWVMAEMEKAGDNKEEAIKRGFEIAVKTMNTAKDLVCGFQVSAPFNRVKVALQVIHAMDK